LNAWPSNVAGLKANSRESSKVKRKCWSANLPNASRPGFTQRTLAKEVGINVSSINFCLKALVSFVMTTPNTQHSHRNLVHTLLAQEHLEFAVLVGSRATGTARPDSDWDIALQWSPQLEWLTVLDRTETLRRTLAKVLQTAPGTIDLIELRRANLAMRASVAEEGLPLTGQDTLAWAHFLQRTWRDMEDFYWSKRHAG
jgi:predicted nucleotidyltransferase